MTEEFNKILDKAVSLCKGKIIKDDSNGFNKIYPFTTECINEYINNFNLKNKSLLTVGSSGDQVINANLKGCNDITLLDINIFSKFYCYLKIAAILELDKDEFLEFFRYMDYPNVFKKNNNVFNMDTFKKIKNTLNSLDNESYIFWNELFSSFKPIDIRENLFEHDEGRNEEIINSNSYLKTDEKYEKSKIKLKNLNINFITQNISEIKLNKTYDNIWLSNIGKYIYLKKFKDVIDEFSKHLNIDGNILICYLYRTIKDTKYKKDWEEIYNLPKVFNIFKDYPLELIEFKGVESFKFKDDKFKDSILMYKKNNN